MLALLLISLLPSAKGQPIERGKQIFEAECTACHTIGEGDFLGPDLKGVTLIRSRDWLLRYTVEPDVMLAEGDQIARQLRRDYPDMEMPNLGISWEDAGAIVDYLEFIDRADRPAIPDEPARKNEQLVGDPLIGKFLYTGEKPFQNAGSSCIACHNIAGLPRIGGGRMGPDLTNTFSRFGESRLRSALRTMPFPVKQHIYRSKPLIEEEVEHLLAFFIEVDTQSPPSITISDTIVRFATIGGAIVLFALVHVIWRKRTRSIRSQLIN